LLFGLSTLLLLLPPLYDFLGAVEPFFSPDKNLARLPAKLILFAVPPAFSLKNENIPPPSFFPPTGFRHANLFCCSAGEALFRIMCSVSSFHHPPPPPPCSCGPTFFLIVGSSGHCSSILGLSFWVPIWESSPPLFSPPPTDFARTHSAFFPSFPKEVMNPFPATFLSN